MVTDKFFHKNIFLDTAPLIYFIEKHSVYQKVLQEVFEANDRGEFTFFTSTITLLEVLVKPLRENQFELAEQYRNILLGSPNLEIFEISSDVATKAAELRAKYNLRTPDALQVATAIEYGTSYFLTNDLRLRSVTDIELITLSDL